MNAVSPAISQAIDGAYSIANGWGAISTGISLLSFGTPGIIAGIGLMLVGGVTMAFGANEILSAALGTNYIQEWTGMSDSAYGWTYVGLNVASSVGTVVGIWGRRIASNHILNSIIQNPSKITNYNLSQIKAFGKYTTQYNPGVLQRGSHAGQGYTLTHVINSSRGYIQWHPGGGHHGSLAYWKITSSYKGSARFFYISGLPF